MIVEKGERISEGIMEGIRVDQICQFDGQVVRRIVCMWRWHSNRSLCRKPVETHHQ